MFKDKAESFWNKNHKILMYIPIILLILSIILIGFRYSTTGDFFKKDISLKGGVSATIHTSQVLDDSRLVNLGVDHSVRNLEDIRSGKRIGIIVEASDITGDELKIRLENLLDIKLDNDNFSVEETSPKLSQSFFKQLVISIIFAFILMGISVFISFRTPAPSIAVIFAALTDIVITLAVINLLGIALSTAGIVAFMLIIGYSIDTDILLTTWSIKRREGKLFDRMWHSMMTGLTMTAAAMVVMLIGLIVSNNLVIKEMFTIIFIALIIDVITTYLTNAGILWIYCKRKNIQ
ncbi:MAG: hypothetical protein AABX19_01270 [Nanoarchaeota archaeon]